MSNSASQKRKYFAEHLFIAIISQLSEGEAVGKVHLAWLNIARKLLQWQVTIKPHM